MGGGGRRGEIDLKLVILVVGGKAIVTDL